ncbi:MAG: hypothetical protein NC098_03200 [Lachnoclostridium sp.]|nr:hypothetical protein [Lachnoclostridium sp.]
MVLTALNPLGSIAQGIADIADALEGVQCADMQVKLSVTLPQNDVDVVYDIKAQATAADSDKYSPCDYLIEWDLTTPSGIVEGFSAYYDGHHYRYRDGRLQEYHAEWDSIPFMGKGRMDGIQSQAQFTDLLPQFMALEIKQTLNDSTYIYSSPAKTTFDGREVFRVVATRTINDMTAMERTYYFDCVTFLPLRVDTESNPGSITEQTILANYTYTAPQGQCQAITEERLIAAYPDAFTKYRQSNFRIENLPGSLLPAFSLPMTDGSRYTYSRGQRFEAPAIITILDASTGFSRNVVDEVRRGVAQLPYQPVVIWAFTGNHRDEIEEVIPSLLPAEMMVTSASGLGRDCGAASYPVVIMADTAGVVKKVILGLNKDMAEDVLQNMALIN